ncbi:hypothetical protein HHI36_013376, partial [Cryptolaemus montrouzieri]
MKNLKKAKARIEALERKFENVREKVSGSTLDDMKCEEYISEMLERQRRASNIMIANVKEATAGKGIERRKEDTNCVKELLKDFSVNMSNIKVVLSHPEDVQKVRRFRKHKSNVVKMFPDQTVRQRDNYTSLKSKFDEMYTQGDESKIIRYLN